MKKILLTIFLLPFILIIFLLAYFGIYSIIDKDYISIEEASERVKWPLNYKKIGFKGLMELKKMEPDEATTKAFAEYERLVDAFASAKYVKYDEGLGYCDDKYLMYYYNDIKYLDSGIKWNFIPELNCKETSFYNKEAKYVFEPRGLTIWGQFIPLILEQIKSRKSFSKCNCSHFFSLILKNMRIKEYANEYGAFNLDSLVRDGISNSWIEANLYDYNIFYDLLINNKFSKVEMQEMLEAIKEYEKLNKPFEYYINKYYDPRIEHVDFLYSHSPIISFISIFYGNAPKEIRKMKDLVLKGDYLKAEDISSEYPYNPYINTIVGINVYNYVLNLSKLAIFKAQLESRLGLEVTAIDPIDNKPIRNRVENGKTVYYCLGFNKEHDYVGSKSQGEISTCIYEPQKYAEKKEKRLKLITDQLKTQQKKQPKKQKRVNKNISKKIENGTVEAAPIEGKNENLTEDDLKKGIKLILTKVEIEELKESVRKRKELNEKKKNIIEEYRKFVLDNGDKYKNEKERVLCEEKLENLNKAKLSIIDELKIKNEEMRGDIMKPIKLAHLKHVIGVQIKQIEKFINNTQEDLNKLPKDEDSEELKSLKESKEVKIKEIDAEISNEDKKIKELIEKGRKK